ncbi:hypothetical protein [Streptomyces antimycoticus]|uniref:hypothetical protein n=1 Tax=Streptomyces antimycoticus TaxID=68175 RepID=UPI0036E74652
MTTAPAPQPPNHDTLTCYTNYKCRRTECVERYNARERERNQQKAAGTYTRLVDAAPVRAHVKTLIAAGATPFGIATRAQVSDNAVRLLLPATPGSRRTPIRHRVCADNARKILAVTVEDVAPPHVDATGTVRRIQALIADGWPMTHLAGPLDLWPNYVWQLLKRARTEPNLQVRSSTARKVAEAYEDLRRKQPTRNSVTPRSAAQARKMAAERRWARTSYWAEYADVLDDPDFTPEYKATRGELLAAEARWFMVTAGLSQEETAVRLGVTKDHLQQTLKRHPASYQEAA